MSDYWARALCGRLAEYARRFDAPGRPVSIKIRSSAQTCFCPNCCPGAFRQIGRYVESHRLVHGRLEHHESGPEILAWAAVAVCGLTLTKSVVELVTAIAKARFAGLQRGDQRPEPIEIVVRDLDDNGEPRQERVMRLSRGEKIDPDLIGDFLQHAVSESSLSPELKHPRRGRGDSKTDRKRTRHK